MNLLENLKEQLEIRESSEQDEKIREALFIYLNNYSEEELQHIYAIMQIGRNYYRTKKTPINLTQEYQEYLVEAQRDNKKYLVNYLHGKLQSKYVSIYSVISNLNR